jgi:tetratricopeptide (TPR) repeat protein/predicted Ser/Thr protein kinase
MLCPACKSETSSEARRCQICDALLPAEEIATSFMPDPRAGLQASGQPTRNLGIAELRAGALLSGRYEILSTLGEGGMGAVYKARDREVDRVVAVKVIRPELANQPEILSRFKQELILSRQVTHKNVVRIFDLGEAEGIKFITMEFVEGRDLRALLRDSTPLSLEQKVKIVIQVCRALEAAHAEGVVHRDLKPQNILIENTGRVVVMDFGIAHSMQEAGATSTGMLLGTPLYMSPEQAKGEKVDPRSDIYTLGIVFYEVLTGKVPFESDTVVGLLLKRLQERPVPPVERNKEIPQALSDIVIKCLAVQKEDRYQSAQEVQRDLEGWLGSPTTFRTVMGTHAAKEATKTPEGRTIVTPRMMMMARSSAWKWIGISVATAAVIIAGVLVAMRLLSKPPAPHSPVTVMIADISNHTGDPIFDGTLEPTFRFALEGAEFISAYDRTRLSDLGVPAVSGKFDEPAAAKIAVNQGLGVVVSGSLDRQGAGYTLSLKAVQAVTGNTIAKPPEGKAANKDQVLQAVTRLAAAIRTALGDATSESDQLFALDTLTANSLESVHEYSMGMDALAGAKYEDAKKSFRKAVESDQKFGLAYAGLAIASSNMRQQQEAERDIKDAVSNIDRMTEREKLRTRGIYYTVFGDQQNCVEEYTELIKRYPSDAMAHNNLGRCYIRLRNMPKALDEMQRAVDILPKRPLSRFNLALYHTYAGEFQTAEKEVRADLQQLDPSYDKGFLTLAYAQLGQNHLDQAKTTYQELEKLSASGASLALTSLADLDFYQGRFGDAVRRLESGPPGKSDAAANRAAALAYVEVARGNNKAAVAAAKRALDNSSAMKIRFLAGRVFAAAGQKDDALDLARKLAAETRAEPQAYGKLIEGEVALESGEVRPAIDSFTLANSILDTWIGHLDLGRAYLKAGNEFLKAETEFGKCNSRRGEAIELFLDDVPTYGYFPPVDYYRGLALEGLNSPEAAKYFRSYLDVRGKGDDHPMLREANRHAGARR